MPTVPRVTQPRVETAALPGVRVSTGAPAAAFGVAAPVDLSGVQSALSQAVQRERQQADEVAILDADQQLGALETRLLYDPETGALTRRGRDALGTPETVGTAWDEAVGALEGRLTGDRQRLALRRLAENRRTSIDRALQRHVGTEIERVDSETAEAHLATEADAALKGYRDPERVALALARQQAVIQDHGRRTGKPPEWVAQRTAAAVSQTHTAIVGRLLDDGDDRAATAYVEANRNAMTGADLAKLTPALEQGSTIGTAQRTVADILETATTRTEALDAVNAIEDPKVKSAARQELRARYADQDAAKRADYQVTLTAAADIVERGGTLTATQRAALEPNDRRALDSWHLKKTSGEPVATDPEAYYTLKRAAAEDPTAFAQANLVRFIDRLSPGDFKELVRQQVAVRQGQADPKVESFRTVNAIVNDAVRASGAFPRASKAGSEDAKRRAVFNQSVDAAILAEQRATGKADLPPDRVQAIVDRQLLQTVFVEEFGRDPELPLGALTADERGRAYVAKDAIPPSEFNAIRQILRSNGRRVTDELVGRAYAAMLLNDRALFDSLTTREP